MVSTSDRVPCYHGDVDDNAIALLVQSLMSAIDTFWSRLKGWLRRD